MKKNKRQEPNRDDQAQQTDDADLHLADDQPADETDDMDSQEQDQQVGQDQAQDTDPVARLEQEKQELNDRLLRVSADYQNYIRRSETHLSQTRDQLLMDLAKALVTVMDHFDLAVQVDPENSSANDVLNGVEMVHAELLNTLKRFGIERVDAQQGDPFDPNRHEAMMRQDTNGEVEPEHIAMQLQPGYMLGDKTVRPAKVTLSQ